MAEAVDGAPLGVLSDVVIAEVTGCTEERAKKRKSLRPRRSRHSRRTAYTAAELFGERLIPSFSCPSTRFRFSSNKIHEKKGRKRGKKKVYIYIYLFIYSLQ